MSIDELTYFGVGVAAGAVATILLTPKSGAETRQALTSKAAEGSDYVATRVNEAGEAATQAIQRGQKTLRQQKENIVAAVDAGVETYREALKTTP
jgi:gas vesicle protein